MQGEAALTLPAARSAGGRAAPVFGRSAALEKEYLRLTAAPTLDSVRPPPVLKQALRLVQQRWLQVNYDRAWSIYCRQWRYDTYTSCIAHVGLLPAALMD